MNVRRKFKPSNLKNSKDCDCDWGGKIGDKDGNSCLGKYCADSGLCIDRLTFEEIDKLYEAGCYRIYHGLESGSNRLRKILNKKFRTNFSTYKGLKEYIGFDWIARYKARYFHLVDSGFVRIYRSNHLLARGITFYPFCIRSVHLLK